MGHIEWHAVARGCFWRCQPEWQLRLQDERRGAEFRRRSPDEADARTAFEAMHPELIRTRRELLSTLIPIPDMLGEDNLADSSEDEDVAATDEKAIPAVEDAS